MKPRPLSSLNHFTVPLAGGGQVPLPGLPLARRARRWVAEPTVLGDAALMASVVNINDVLEGHVALDIECVDRLYLNAYVPKCRSAGRWSGFSRHLGKPIPSAACWARSAIAFGARSRRLPLRTGSRSWRSRPDRSRWDDRKLDHVRVYLEAAERERRFGVVAIVACQEFQWVFAPATAAGARPSRLSSSARSAASASTTSTCSTPTSARVYQDLHLLPYPAKVWVNGTSGPSARPSAPASSSARSRTGLPLL